MKTPDEIKKGLAVCCGYEISCRECPYDCSPNSCDGSPEEDAIEYINQLESRLAQVERERDAAVDAIKKASIVLCSVCKHDNWPECKKGCDNLIAYEVVNCKDFEWRGVCEENTKEEK